MLYIVEKPFDWKTSLVYKKQFIQLCLLEKSNPKNKCLAKKVKVKIILQVNWNELRKSKHFSLCIYTSLVYTYLHRLIQNTARARTASPRTMQRIVDCATKTTKRNTSYQLSGNSNFLRTQEWCVAVAVFRTFFEGTFIIKHFSSLIRRWVDVSASRISFYF